MTWKNSHKLCEFQNIYKENHLFVRKSLHWVLGRDSVDEIVQEVFLKVWKAWPKFKRQSSVKTWVYRITMNCAYDYLKKEARQSKKEPVPSPDTAPSSESQLAIENLVRDAISRLSKKQRDVFVLYYFQGFPVEKVGKILEISEGTVKSRLHHGRKIVETCLIKHGVKI